MVQKELLKKLIHKKRNLKGATVAAPTEREQILSVDQYAKANSLSFDEVWNLIHQGKLFARMVDHKICIFTKSSQEEVDSTEEQVISKSAYVSTTEVISKSETNLQTNDQLEILKYLNSVREENKQILALTQQVITQMNNMSTRVESLKDEILALKSKENARLEQSLIQKEKEALYFKQEIEDLKTLVKTYESQLKS